MSATIDAPQPVAGAAKAFAVRVAGCQAGSAFSRPASAHVTAGLGKIEQALTARRGQSRISGAAIGGESSVSTRVSCELRGLARKVLIDANHGWTTAFQRYASTINGELIPLVAR